MKKSQITISIIFSLYQLEEERQRQKEKRKKERAKLLEKKRNLEGLVKDAQKKTAEFEKKVHVSVSNEPRHEKICFCYM